MFCVPKPAYVSDNVADWDAVADVGAQVPDTVCAPTMPEANALRNSAAAVSPDRTALTWAEALYEIINSRFID